MEKNLEKAGLKQTDFERGVARAYPISNWKITSPNQVATVGKYFFEGPLHPIWSRWAAIVVHLHDIPWVAPARKRFSAATHELAALAIDPKYPKIDSDAPGDSLGFLSPSDSILQFQAKSDVESVEIAEGIIRKLCAGTRATTVMASRFSESQRNGVLRLI